jgi:hypothetical protein
MASYGRKPKAVAGKRKMKPKVVAKRRSGAKARSLKGRYPDSR